MKKIFISCVTLLVFVCTHALSQVKTDTTCANATSQLERYKCLGKEYTRIDKDLNSAYAKILNKLNQEKDNASVKALTLSQRNWITFRSNFAKVYEELYKGGSIMPITVLECEIETTRLRIIELNNLFGDINR